MDVCLFFFFFVFVVSVCRCSVCVYMRLFLCVYVGLYLSLSVYACSCLFCLSQSVSCTLFLSFTCLEPNIASLLSPFCSSSEPCPIHLQLTTYPVCPPYILFIITQEQHALLRSRAIRRLVLLYNYVYI